MNEQRKSTADDSNNCEIKKYVIWFVWFKKEEYINYLGQI